MSIPNISAIPAAPQSQSVCLLCGDRPELIGLHAVRRPRAGAARGDRTPPRPRAARCAAHRRLRALWAVCRDATSCGRSSAFCWGTIGDRMTWRPAPVSDEISAEDRLDAALSMRRAAGGSCRTTSRATGGARAQAGAACDSPGKHPWLKEWPTKATTDVATICGWLDERPTTNLGLATGAGSGLIALDIDPRHGGDESLAMLEARHGAAPADGAAADRRGRRAHPPQAPGLPRRESAGDRDARPGHRRAGRRRPDRRRALAPCERRRLSVGGRASSGGRPGRRGAPLAPRAAPARGATRGGAGAARGRPHSGWANATGR